MPPISLEIYVEPRCLASQRSLQLAAEMRRSFPEIVVRVVDLTEGVDRNENPIVATPTFILNGHTFSLGNPTRAELEHAITTLIAQETNS